MTEKLKILYINNEAEELGGCSFSLLQLIQSLHNNVEPLIVLRKRGVVYDFFRQKGCKVIICNFCFNYISKSIKFRTLLYPYKVLRNRLINFLAISKLSSLIKKEGINLIHSNSSVVDLGYFLSKKSGIPHIWHLREFIDKGLNIKPIGGYSHWLNEVKKSWVITISKSLYNHLGLENCKNAFCLEDAVIDGSEVIASKLENSTKYVVVLAGRIHPIKYPQEAIELYYKSSIYKENIILKIVGRCSEEYKNQLLHTVPENIRQYIVFEDFTLSISNLLVNAMALISSSHFEGLGRVMIEAMHYNCPVLSYNGGGGSSIISDHVTGYLYNNVDEGSIKLKEIISNDQTIIINNAKQLVDKKYSIESYGENLLKIYEEVLK